jgi:hypothetical protein
MFKPSITYQKGRINNRMPAVKSQISCPNCRQPVVVDVEQLFDLNQDPTAKELLLAGAVNVIQCPHCGYQGNLSTPVVYHDPEKDMLLTFVPGELGLPRDEQEKIIGKLINQVVDNLPQEKRKAYLFNPQATLTFQGLIERVLEADGITKEMIEAQQKKLTLIQQLLSASDDVVAEIAKSEDQALDAEFFAILGRLAEGSLASGDREASQSLIDLQEKLLPLTTFGRQVQEQIGEMEAAARSLQEAGESLTREKLLELIVEAPNDTRLRAYVNLARQGIDYTFFQLLTDRIDDASDEEDKGRLVDLREKLLSFTREMDQQLESRLGQARQLLTAILQSHDIAEAIAQNMNGIDEYFVQVLNLELENAQKSGDQTSLGKLQQIVATLEQLSAPPPEVAFVQELMDLEDDEARVNLMNSRADEITPQFLDILVALLNQAQSGDDPQITDRLRAVHRLAVRQSMEAKLKGS